MAEQSTETQFEQGREPGPDHRLLDVLVGRWINEGETVPSEGAPAVKILTSDVYEWMPGGFFVLHTAYGRIGEVDVGGTEIIGYDEASKKYRTHFFDSQGNITTEELTVRDGVWTWQGNQTRATGTFSVDGRTLPVLHERSDDGVNWLPAMEVTLSKVE